MRILFVWLVAAASLAVATAADKFTVTLFQESIVNGKTLKAGDYRLTFDGGKAVIARGKDKVEADVRVETVETRYNSTSVRYNNGDGKYRITEIRLGGTQTKLVFTN